VPGQNLAEGLPPAQPQVTRLFRDAYHDLVLAASFDDDIAGYHEVCGLAELREVIASEHRQYFGLPVTSRNVLVTPGSQAIFYYLCTLMAGRGKKVRFTGPEYPGYRTHDAVQYDMVMPIVQDDAHGDFRYLPRLGLLDRSVGAVLLSRPGNPTGNVLGDALLGELASECAGNDTLLVLDNAYAPPVPALCFAELGLPWNDHVVLAHSFSMTGFAGERLGFAVAPEHLIDALARVQARVAIAPPQLTQRAAAAVLADGRLARACRESLRPAYAERHGLAREVLASALRAPARFHAADGGPFLWMWCPDLPGPITDLCTELRSDGVLIAPGASFFLPELRSAPHAMQCMRISLTGTLESLEAALVTLSTAINRRAAGRTAAGRAGSGRAAVGRLIAS
jgi:valine--pyruvate aminotransferase